MLIQLPPRKRTFHQSDQFLNTEKGMKWIWTWRPGRHSDIAWISWKIDIFYLFKMFKQRRDEVAWLRRQRRNLDRHLMVERSGVPRSLLGRSLLGRYWVTIGHSKRLQSTDLYCSSSFSCLLESPQQNDLQYKERFEKKSMCTTLRFFWVSQL